MAIQVFSNNATTTLATSIASGTTSLQVTSGTGSLFPALSSGNWFIATIMHIVSNTVTAYEIVQATARVSDTLTIVRAQEGTSAQAWTAGDTIALLPTAGGYRQFTQPSQAQAFSTNIAQDVGAANAYSVTLTPPLTNHIPGMPIIWKAAHGNTGNCTFNDGVGVQTLFTAHGTQIAPSVINSSGIYITVWDGSVFRLLGQPSGTCPQLVNNLSDMPNPLASLANLGGTNASNLNAGTLAYALTGGQVSLATNGYEIMPSGRIEQWGTTTVVSSSPTTVNFPFAFPNACANIQVTNYQTGGGFVQLSVESFTLSNFTASIGGSVQIMWRAVGY